MEFACWNLDLEFSDDSELASDSDEEFTYDGLIADPKKAEVENATTTNVVSFCKEVENRKLFDCEDREIESINTTIVPFSNAEEKKDRTENEILDAQLMDAYETFLQVELDVKNNLNESWTRENYRSRMLALLRAEKEARCALLAARCALCTRLKLLRSYNVDGLNDTASYFAPRGEVFAKVTLEGCLSEDMPAGRLLLRQVDMVLVAVSPSEPKFECKVAHALRDVIYLRLPAHMVAHFQIEVSEDGVEPCEFGAKLEFKLNCAEFAEMHYAVMHLPDTRLVFPEDGDGEAAYELDCDADASAVKVRIALHFFTITSAGASSTTSHITFPFRLRSVSVFFLTDGTLKLKEYHILMSTEAERRAETERKDELNGLMNSRQRAVATACLQSLSIDAELDEPYRPPVLVAGPFGTGKTFTLAHVAKTVLSESTDSKLLICTLSNSAADLYIQNYFSRWIKDDEDGFPRPLRVYYTGRWVSSIPEVVRPFCCLDEPGMIRSPTTEEIFMSRLVITTLNTARFLLKHVERGWFTHILIDEAGQAFEPQALIPLCLAGPKTTVVLAGDPFQSGPECYSQVAKRCGFGRSLLDRLWSHYPKRHSRRIHLRTNYRSHSALLDFLSDCFYGEKFRSACELPAHPDYYPLTFVATRGIERQDDSSTAFYNTAEVHQTVETVAKILDSWPEFTWGPRSQKQIGVLAIYSDQILRIRKQLRMKGYGGVQVERVQNVQGFECNVAMAFAKKTKSEVKLGNSAGKEYKVIILSAVRTLHTCDPSKENKPGSRADFGFLSDPRLLNTALTRAQTLTVAVGDPASMCALGACRSVWQRYVKKADENGSLKGTTWALISAHLDSIRSAAESGSISKLYLNPRARDFRPLSPPPTINDEPGIYPDQKAALAVPLESLPAPIGHFAAFVATDKGIKAIHLPRKLIDEIVANHESDEPKSANEKASDGELGGASVTSANQEPVRSVSTNHSTGGAANVGGASSDPLSVAELLGPMGGTMLAKAGTADILTNYNAAQQFSTNRVGAAQIPTNLSAAPQFTTHPDGTVKFTANHSTATQIATNSGGHVPIDPLLQAAYALALQQRRMQNQMAYANMARPLPGYQSYPPPYVGLRPWANPNLCPLPYRLPYNQMNYQAAVPNGLPLFYQKPPKGNAIMAGNFVMNGQSFPTVAGNPEPATVSGYSPVVTTGGNSPAIATHPPGTVDGNVPEWCKNWIGNTNNLSGNVISYDVELGAVVNRTNIGNPVQSSNMAPAGGNGITASGNNSSVNGLGNNIAPVGGNGTTTSGNNSSVNGLGNNIAPAGGNGTTASGNNSYVKDSGNIVQGVGNGTKASCNNSSVNDNVSQRVLPSVSSSSQSSNTSNTHSVTVDYASAVKRRL